MLVAIIGLNLFDAVATLTWLDLGFAEEANPLMEPLIAYCPLCFVAIKMSIVLLVCWFLWREKENTYSFLASKIVFSAYTLLALWHMVGFYKMFCLFS
jgi:hypothetical protein